MFVCVCVLTQRRHYDLFLLDCLSLVSLFNSSTPSICPSDVTFTVAGGDGDGRGGCFAGQTRLRTGRVPQAVHGAVLVRQGANRAAGQDLLLEPEEDTDRQRKGTTWRESGHSAVGRQSFQCCWCVCFLKNNNGWTK